MTESEGTGKLAGENKPELTLTKEERAELEARRQVLENIRKASEEIADVLKKYKLKLAITGDPQIRILPQ